MRRRAARDENMKLTRLSANHQHSLATQQLRRSSLHPLSLVPLIVSWQQAMKEAVRDPAQLCRLLDLPPQFAARGRRAPHSLFHFSSPAASSPACGRGDPADPLVRQVLPAGTGKRTDGRIYARSGGRCPGRTTARAAAQVPWTSVDGNNWGLRRPLPLLFSPAFPL